MRRAWLLLLAVGALGTAGCGGKAATTAPPATTSTRATTTQGAPATTPLALQAEATSAAAGDIPDNQVFIGFRDAAVHYAVKYPEGWAQQGSGGQVTFRDKNNIVRIVVSSAAAPTAARITHELAALSGAHVQGAPQRLTLAGSPAYKVVYTTESPANPVTGKRVTLTVDRYYLAHAGKVAVVDLGSPVGVDNVDAYLSMIESFRWR